MRISDESIRLADQLTLCTKPARFIWHTIEMQALRQVVPCENGLREWLNCMRPPTTFRELKFLGMLREYLAQNGIFLAENFNNKTRSAKLLKTYKVVRHERLGVCLVKRGRRK